jgi:hypothetical protein
MRSITLETNRAEAAKLAKTIVDVPVIIITLGTVRTVKTPTTARATNKTVSAGIWSLLATWRALGKWASTAVSGGAKYTKPMSKLTTSPDTTAPASKFVGKR